MPNTTKVNAFDGAGISLKKWYTGRTIHATATSRGFANFDLAHGDIVCLDPYSNTSGHEGMAIGTCVGLPTSGSEKLPHFVVVGVHPDVNRGVDPGAAVDVTGMSSTPYTQAPNPRNGGWVEVCAMGVCDAYVKGSAIAVGDVMAVTPIAISSGLVTRAYLAEAATTAYNDATLDTLAEQLGVYAIHKAMALEADTSNNIVLKRVALGGLGGNQAL